VLKPGRAAHEPAWQHEGRSVSAAPGVSRTVSQAVIDGLLRRAEAQAGPVRQLLLQRAAQLQAAQAAPGGGVPALPGGTPVAAQPLRDLGELIDRLGRGGQRPAAVASFHGTWARLRTQQRLRQALAVVPQQAGPLHSAHLVHRALEALHMLSPAYLEAVLSHLDTLLWLDAASGGGLGGAGAGGHAGASAGAHASAGATPGTPRKKRPGRSQGAK
jgi:hypothetical protein